MNTVMDQGLPGGLYGLSNFTPDGQPYSSSDLPPRMRQQLVPQGIPLDGRLVTPKTDISTRNLADSPLHPLFHHHPSTGESDSGIDVSFVGFQSDWSQSSPSSSIAPNGYINGPTSGISPTVGDVTAQYWTDPAVQALFAAQVDQTPHHTWQPTAQNKPHDEYTAFLPSQPRQGYQQPDNATRNFGPTRAAITAHTQYAGLKGNGKHQARFSM